MATSKTKVGFISAAVVAAALTTTMFLMSSSDINVPVGGDVNAAVATAPCGTTIIVEAGQAYDVNMVLPQKDCGEQWITIQSSRASELPEGVRVGPAQAALFARLQSTVNATPVVRTAPGAHHYKFIGIQFQTRDEGVFVYDLVRLGESRHEQKTLESVPHYIVIDRSWVRGWPTQDVQRGISLNSAETTISNSYISDIHGIGYDTQAIAGWNGPGPYHIINNHLEGAGENILFGGADPGIPNLVPSDIEIRRNYVFKPLSWKVGHPTYAGKHWTIKNSLELKNARNVVIDGNVFENCWADGQVGIPILFTVRNQEGTAPWSIVTNVSFTNNVVKNAVGGINFLGTDNEQPSAQSSAALIKNNVFDQITGPFLTLNGFHDVTLEENTHLQTCAAGCNTMTLYGNPSLRFAYRRNVTEERDYGIFGDGGLIGKLALDKWTPAADVTGNVIAKPYDNGRNYPIGNDYPAALVITTDYRTPYTGKGANIDTLLTAQAGAVSQPTPQPTSTVSSPTPVTTPTPAPLPSPSPSPTSLTVSPNGTKALMIVDAQLNVWTLGPQKQTLRNGTQVGGGAGLIYKWQDGMVHVLGTDNVWYRWQGNAWRKGTTNEPGPVTRSVPWPSQTGEWNTLLDTQRRDGYWLLRIEGSTATFERVE